MIVEGENIIDLNASTRNLYGMSASMASCTKIISDSSEFIPICSIPKIICNNVSVNSNIKRQIIQAFEEIGIKEEIIDFLREDSIYPKLLKEIVVAAIYRILSKNCDLVNHYYYSRDYAKNQILELFTKITKEQFYILLSYLVIKDKINLDIDIVDKNINNCLLDNVIGIYGSINTYDKAMTSFHTLSNNDKFCVFKTRNSLFKYVIGKYYIAHYNMITGETIPLVCMVAKRKNLPYFKASQVIDDYVFTDYVELWVKDDFDIAGSIHRGLRPKYRKFIKTPLQKAGVKIITKPNFNEMLLNYSLPKFKDIKGYEEFLRKASIEALECIEQ